jgi:hypothetical protein
LRTQEEIRNAITRVLNAETDNFVELTKLAGLDPERDFQHANISGVDFSGLDLSGFNFTGARMIGCKFDGASTNNTTFSDGSADALEVNLSSALSKDKLLDKQNKNNLLIRVPRLNQERVDTYKEWLCGIYICYRYSFEINYDDSVTREVLRVWYDLEEGAFKFQLWYVAGGAKPGSSVDSFDGPVVLVGEMIMFVGVSRDRARSVFWTYDSDDEIVGHFKHCRFGMTVSAKARDDRAPVAACTICIKLDNTPKDWQWWCSKNSMIIGVDTFKNIIGTDFRDENNQSHPSERTAEQWVGLFIENKPMTKMETEHEAEDRILRLNLKRFRIRMDQIRSKMIASNKPTPFNAGKWEKEQRLAQARPKTINN